MIMKSKGNIGIFGGISAGSLDGNGCKRDLFSAFAGHVLIGDGLGVEVMGGQGIHVVTTSGAVEDIGFEHGVETDSLKGDAEVLKDMGIVFQVLPNLAKGGIFKQRFKFFEDH